MMALLLRAAVLVCWGFGAVLGSWVIDQGSAPFLTILALAFVVTVLGVLPLMLVEKLLSDRL